MPLFYDLKPIPPAMEKPGPEHELFKQWVLENDVTIKGIAPARFYGRGIGIVAERNIEAGEVFIRVPTEALLTTDSIIPEVKTAAVEAGISIHGLLAMYLAISAQDEEDPYSAWRRVWPTKDDLSSMPVYWPYSIRGLKKSPSGDRSTWSPLPPSINGEWSKEAIPDVRYAALATGASRLEKQRRKIDKDWTRAKGLCEGRLEYNDYLYHWLIVNTRSFFFDLTEDEWEGREDKMALCPFIDYFNHSSQGCEVGFNDEGYNVTADRAYSKGEELFVSYGDHDNDLLLVDYGFLLEENNSDAVPLDDLVLFGPHGVYKHKELLAEKNYFGDYAVSKADGICWRTHMAAALNVLSEEEWKKVADGDREMSDAETAEASSFVKTKWVAAWLKEAERALAAWNSDAMQDSKEVDESKRQMAVSRWNQVQQVLQAVM